MKLTKQLLRKWKLEIYDRSETKHLGEAYDLQGMIETDNDDDDESKMETRGL